MLSFSKDLAIKIPHDDVLKGDIVWLQQCRLSSYEKGDIMNVQLATNSNINNSAMNTIWYIPKEVHSLNTKKNTYKKMDVTPHLIRDTPELIKILLKDRTTRKNIIWATDSYSSMGTNFFPEANIKVESITNGAGRLVRPRVTKMLEEQESRTREKGEVFTDIRIIKKQNDLLEKEFSGLPLEEYVNKIWLEIACGEAPYMCSRYDTVSGKSTAISKRVGFVDRKIQRISKEVNNHEVWLELVRSAYKASYGYEYQGDSLILARENLLYTFIDYYVDKFNVMPEIEYMKEIASIISYNVFQMDGLKYTVPLSERTEIRAQGTQLSLFEEKESKLDSSEIVKVGIKAKVKNWNNNRMVVFESLKEGGQQHEI